VKGSTRKAKGSSLGPGSLLACGWNEWVKIRTASGVRKPLSDFPPFEAPEGPQG